MLLELEGLDHVAFLDVGVALDADAALEARLDVADIVLEEVHRWLELPDDFLPTVVLTLVVANGLSESDPVWVMIVAPPSSGKTELIQAVEEIDGVHALGKLTGRTFVSGMFGDNRSLLVWLAAMAKWPFRWMSPMPLRRCGASAQNSESQRLCARVPSRQRGYCSGVGGGETWNAFL